MSNSTGVVKEQARSVPLSCKVRLSLLSCCQVKSHRNHLWLSPSGRNAESVWLGVSSQRSELAHLGMSRKVRTKHLDISSPRPGESPVGGVQYRSRLALLRWVGSHSGSDIARVLCPSHGSNGLQPWRQFYCSYSTITGPSRNEVDSGSVLPHRIPYLIDRLLIDRTWYG